MANSFPTVAQGPGALARRHAVLYDSLADDYDQRADLLRDVTVASVSRLLELGVQAGGRALDVGCGAGLVTRLLADAGHPVVAVDVAPRMAAVCARRAPAAEVLTGDYLSVSVPGRFAVVAAFAFIHLFPKPLARRYLLRMREHLSDDGLMLIGTTAEARSREGLEAKADYPGSPARFRRRWTERDFLAMLGTSDLRVLDVTRHRDPLGKTWVDAIAVRT